MNSFEKPSNDAIYLVVDPAAGLPGLLPKLKSAIEGGIDAVQIWNNWSNYQDKQEVVETICRLAHDNNIPVLINEEWQLLPTTEIDGVHFDKNPGNLTEIREIVGRPIIAGLTCGNDMGVIRTAIQEGFDYISFCSMFPSDSAGVCEIVSPEIVRQARQLTGMPIFLAGGINLDNIGSLKDTGMNGIALISAIMKAEDPKHAVQSFRKKLNTIK